MYFRRATWPKRPFWRTHDLCGMCYGVKARTEMSLRIAKVRGDEAAVARLRMLLADAGIEHNFANAFDHPQLVLYTDAAPREPQLFIWGLVPAWVKSADQQRKLWNQTLNARGETIFEKAAFRGAARARRALLYVEGFYEHFHLGGRTYPFFIRLRGRPHFALAALWEEWPGAGGPPLRTFSVVISRANDLLRRIHNNPKSGEPRMPLILAPEEEEQWLAPANSDADRAHLQGLVRPYPAGAMEAHAVRALLGKMGCGNAPWASDAFDYPELALGGPLA